MPRALVLMGTILLAVAAVASAQAQSYLFTGVRALDCYDGDTCTFDILEDHPILGRLTFRAVSVRIQGLDAPERRGRCDAEKRLAAEARRFLLDLIAKAGRVDLRVAGRDKYGRLLATVIVDGADAAPRLIDAGLARAYTGRGPRGSWCEADAAAQVTEPSS
ncbi:MAG: thermonuclease family protein [SAR324 cluster bacterium]|nr:thermonuclease family protein [SAR324 cluster bacterium]